MLLIGCLFFRLKRLVSMLIPQWCCQRIPDPKIIRALLQQVRTSMCINQVFHDGLGRTCNELARMLTCDTIQYPSLKLYSSESCGLTFNGLLTVFWPWHFALIVSNPRILIKKYSHSMPTLISVWFICCCRPCIDTTAAQHLELLLHSRNLQTRVLSWPGWSLHILPVTMWVSSECLFFSHIRKSWRMMGWNGHCKLPRVC